MNECVKINLTATGKTRRESRVDGEIDDCCFPWTESNDPFGWAALQNQAQKTCLCDFIVWWKWSLNLMCMISLFFLGNKGTRGLLYYTSHLNVIGIKRLFTHKTKYCHCSFTLMLFQTHTTFCFEEHWGQNNTTPRLLSLNEKTKQSTETSKYLQSCSTTERKSKNNYSKSFFHFWKCV